MQISVSCVIVSSVVGINQVGETRRNLRNSISFFLLFYKKWCSRKEKKCSWGESKNGVALVVLEPLAGEGKCT